MSKKAELLRLRILKHFPVGLTTVVFNTEIDFDKLDGLKARLCSNSIVLDEDCENEYDVDELSIICLHMLLSKGLGHYKRYLKHVSCGNKLTEVVWNVASELARTSFLKLCNIKVPDFFIDPENYGLPSNLSAEEYYDILTSKDETIDSKIKIEFSGSPQKSKEKNPDNYGDGNDYESDHEDSGMIIEFSSSGKSEENSDDYEEGDSYGSGHEDSGIDDDDFVTVDEEVMSQIMDNQAIQDMEKFIESIGRGMLHNSGEIKKVRELVNPEEHLIIKKLRSIIKALAYKGPGHKIPTGRPCRRNPGKAILLDTLPAGYKRVAILVDVSDSTHSFREEVYSALITVLRALKNIDVYIGDTVFITKIKNVRNENRLTGLPEGFGTDMGDLMEQIDSAGYYKSILVITDCITPWPNKKLRADCYLFPIGYYQDQLKDVPSWIRRVI